MSARAYPVVLLMLGLLGLGCPRAHAALLDCTLGATISTNGVNFNTYNPLLATATSANGSVTFGCTVSVVGSTPITVALSTGSSNTYTTRTMTSNGHSLSYNLYMNSCCTQVWGDGTGTSQLQTYTFNFVLAALSQSQTFTIFGQIPAGQRQAYPGSYSDTITVTVDF